LTSKQKSKGYRYEKKTEEFLNGIPGVTARRSLASGAYGRYDASLDGDVQADINGTTYKVEVKARKAPPVYQQKAMRQGDGIAVLWWTKQGKGENGTQNGSECWVLMRWDRFKELMER
jgi:Holliday junction resolvase